MDLKPCEISGLPIVCPVKLIDDDKNRVYDYFSLTLWLSTYGTHPISNKTKANRYPYGIDDIVFSEKDYKHSLLNTRTPIKSMSDSEKYVFAKAKKIDNFYKTLLSATNDSKKNNKSKTISFLQKLKGFFSLTSYPTAIEDPPKKADFYTKCTYYFKYKHLYYQMINYHEKCQIWGERIILNGVIFAVIAISCNLIFESFSAPIRDFLLLISLLYVVIGLIVAAYPCKLNRVGLLNSLLERDDYVEFYNTNETLSYQNNLNAMKNPSLFEFDTHGFESSFSQSKTNNHNSSLKNLQNYIIANFERITSSFNFNFNPKKKCNIVPSIFHKKPFYAIPFTCIIYLFDLSFSKLTNLNCFGNYSPKEAATLRRMNIQETKYSQFSKGNQYTPARNNKTNSKESSTNSKTTP